MITIRRLGPLVLLGALLACSDGSTDGEGGSGGTSDAGGAGSPGSGGGGPGSGAGPHINVGNCDELGAAVGQWVDITPPDFRVSDILETTTVATDALNPSVVYSSAGDKTNGGTGSTGVYRSNDCGATFEKVSSGAFGDRLDTGDVWQLGVDALNSDVYATNGYGNDPTLYKSTNGGVDWKQLDPDPANVAGAPFVQSFATDPADPKHLVVTFHVDCEKTGANLGPMCMSETKDGGATWRQFKGPGGGFEEAAWVLVTGPDSWFYFSANGGWYTENGGDDWQDFDLSGVLTGFIASDGKLYISRVSVGILKASLDEPITPGSFSLLAGAPQATAMIDDGKSLITSWGYVGSHVEGDPVFFSAPLEDPTTWEKVVIPGIKRGGLSMSYDAAHHIVYSANWGGGLWRMRTR